VGPRRLLLRFALLVAAAGVARAQPPAEQRLTLRVGQPVAFTPVPLPTQVICDDLSIVRVEDAVDHLRLIGLKPGSTSCSFGSAALAGRRVLYHFVVTP
jgi:hypothetical protein